MDNQLQVIVKESGLEQSKASFILERFQNYFEIADEWSKKASSIVVTNASQKAEMDMARTGRLFLREKRIAIEKSRKELKEQALREGKAIDGIANVLKALIIPIEEHLDRQEHYVELKAAAELAEKQKEIAWRIEEERISQEKAEAEKQEQIRLENIRLRQEYAEKEKQLEAERAKARMEKQALEQKAAADRKAIEDKARKEREKQQRILAEQKAKADAERQALAEKAKAERERHEKQLAKAERKVEKLIEKLIECPFCHNKFSIKEGS